MIVEKLSWKEIVAAIIVLGIGIVLLLLEIASIISSKSSFVTSQENTISINKSELLGHIRFVITILFSLTAGTLLLRKIRLGWVLAVPILLFSCFLCGYFIYFLYSMAFIDATVAILIGGFLLLLSALIFLIRTEARKKYGVGKHTYLPTFFFLLLICALFFFLQ